ncbi:MAG: 2-hydroxychromene-2-carboxylate isomerase [Hyphomonas sp.]|mgnify:CR=1 FL=1|nr:2-hydroxychromene-2-carboxylate isomerase [Hyphomonas sp.]HRX72643.1 2-hydroxychromene-2-carboxylate isomerase [Hyphomonas sp.]
MAKALEFYFDYISPYSHIANAAVKQLRERTGATVEIRPMFLGAIMQGTGNRPPATVPAKGAYMLKDLDRCAARYGLKVRMNPHFPMVNTRGLLRATCGLAANPAEQQRFMDACFRHMWETPDPLNPGDDASVEAMCKAEGFDFAEIQRLAEDEASKAAMKANTDSAMARGAFGAPTFFVGDEMFFGHDRLDYAVEAMNA